MPVDSVDDVREGQAMITREGERLTGCCRELSEGERAFIISKSCSYDARAHEESMASSHFRLMYTYLEKRK